MRFLSLQRIGLKKGVFCFRDLPHPENVTPSRFGYRLDALPNPRPWDLFSYPSAHEISPLELFPF